MATEMPLALAASGVSKVFDDFVALADVEISVHTSEVLCLVGPSGCGKTTLLNLMAGFEEPSSGSIFVDGRPVTRPGPDRTVVFQQDALFPWLTVRQNVTAGARATKQRNYAGRADSLLAHVRLSEFADRYPYQLSGGMRQRAAIARALMAETKVLLMDEPFGALDAQTRSAMQDLLQEIWEAYRPTIVFITHDIEEALLLGDRVVVMAPNPGRIVKELTVPFRRPRGVELTTTPEFNEMKALILRLLHPDAATTTV